MSDLELILIHTNEFFFPRLYRSSTNQITDMSLLNQLQVESVTLMQPMSDLELILIHTSQYSDHDRFGPI